LAGAIWELVLSEGVRRISDQTTLIIYDHLLIKNNHQKLINLTKLKEVVEYILMKVQ